ncbi:tyrosine-type recombinase/integrase [Micromonospora palomenae]|uniref:tyrosine-type recombinase/integrase n=1 Tax=Micromonospora palomenae TaxID=1461247 RepID=UPI003F89CE12
MDCCSPRRSALRSSLATSIGTSTSCASRRESGAFRAHDLRHSCPTLLYDQGVPLERIQDVLGHSSPTVTKSIYVEATRRVQQDAVDRLGFLFDA